MHKCRQRLGRHGQFAVDVGVVGSKVSDDVRGGMVAESGSSTIGERVSSSRRRMKKWRGGDGVELRWGGDGGV